VSDYDDLISGLANGQAPDPFKLRTVLMDLHASAGDVASLSSTVSGHTSTLSSQGSTVSSHTSTLSNHESRITAAETDIDNIQAPLIALHIL
jgi:hypothetical protein